MNSLCCIPKIPSQSGLLPLKLGKQSTEDLPNSGEIHLSELNQSNRRRTSEVALSPIVNGEPSDTKIRNITF